MFLKMTFEMACFRSIKSLSGTGHFESHFMLSKQAIPEVIFKKQILHFVFFNI